MTEVQSSNFPQKLFSLMENEPGDVVAWSERGLSFRVVNPDKFAEEVVPKYFRHTKMTSFQRQLNLYGFRRVTKGDDVGSYYHPKFQRGRRDLIGEIKRLPGKTGAYNHLNNKASVNLSSSDRFNPSEGNIVEVMDSNNRPQTMSKLTMKISGINPHSARVLDHPQPSTLSAPLGISPAYVTDNAVVFINVGQVGAQPSLPTVCLSTESSVLQTPQPLLLRNFSVSSTFDEEYRLTDAADMSSSRPCDTQPDGDSEATAPLSRYPSTSMPPPPSREESESWMKLGALDQMHDMDPFDLDAIDTVFE